MSNWERYPVSDTVCHTLPAIRLIQGREQRLISHLSQQDQRLGPKSHGYVQYMAIPDTSTVHASDADSFQRHGKDLEHHESDTLQTKVMNRSMQWSDRELLARTYSREDDEQVTQIRFPVGKVMCKEAQRHENNGENRECDGHA